MSTRPIVREYVIDTPAAWEVFVREAWSKSPARLTMPGIDVSEARLFRLLCAVAERDARGARTTMRIYPESRARRVVSAERDALVDHERAACMPRREDDGFLGYCARVRGRLGRGAALVTDNLERFDAELWLEVRRAFRGLFDRVPLFSRQGMMTFAGDYASTPFGVHKDEEHVFHVAVCGKKRMRFWAKDFIAKHPEMDGLMDYTPFLDDSVAVEGRLGEILYWPSRFYHIGECDGPAAHFSVGFQAPRSAATEVWTELAQLVWHDLIGERDRTDDAQLSDPIAEPRMLLDARAEARRRFEAIMEDPRLDRTLKKTWLNRKTADGFENVPDPLPRAPLAMDDVLEGDPAFPLRTVDLDDDEMLCGAHGQSVSLPRHAAMYALVARLASGAPISVRSAVDLVAAHRGDGDADLDADADDVIAMLEALETMRAFSRVSPPPGASRTRT